MKITPDNIIYNYAYDDDGNLTTITTPLGDFTFTYDAANRRYTRTAPNGTTSTYSYDTINRLTGIETKQGETTIIDNVNYPQFDNVGNRMAKTKLYPQQENWTYTYDDIYRLTTVKLSDVQVVEDYTYDDVGNRQTSGIEQFPQTNEAVVYSYDDENRLTGVQITQGSLVKQLTFAYDPFGRRIKKIVSPSGGGSGEVTTNYVYDGQNIIMEYDQNNNITAKYTHGPNIDEPLAVQQGTNTYYYHADGLGSITSLSNASGSIVQTYSYDSFGNITVSSSISQPFTYTAREYDSETGMYFYRARYYDPKVGRFVTKDPIGFEGGDYNLYAYVGNNPVNATDPSGREVKKCKRPLDGLEKIHGKFYHDFILLNGADYGFFCKGCKLEGPGEVRGPKVETDFRKCEVVECIDEAKLLQNILASKANPGRYNIDFWSCQEWAEYQLSSAKK